MWLRQGVAELFVPSAVTRSVIDFYPWLCFLRVQLPAVNHGSKILNVNFQM